MPRGLPVHPVEGGLRRLGRLLAGLGVALALSSALSLAACGERLALHTASPSVGPSSGGLPISLRGSGFRPGALVRVEGELAQDATVVSSEELQLTLPSRPGALRTVSVEVVNTGGESVVRDDLFAYFGSCLHLPSPGEHNQLLIADFDGDGRADLAALDSSDNSVLLLFATGVGRFDRSVRLPLVDLSWESDRGNSLAVADFDGDGLPDIASAKPASLWRNLGGGRFAAAASLAPGSLRQVAAGDFDADGQPDLVLWTREDQAVALLNRGGGTFAPAIAVPVDHNPGSLLVADFNSDGKADLAVRTSAGLSIQLAVAGPPAAPVIFPVSATTVTAGDLNGDGAVDLVTGYGGDPYSTVSHFLGDGAGGFTAADSWTVRGAPADAAIGDVDGDGIADLVVSTWDAGLNLRLGKGAGAFGPNAELPAAYGSQSVVIGDLDGDGRRDLAASSWFGGISLVLTSNVGGFNPPLEFPADRFPGQLVAADFNGDDKVDAAITQWFVETLNFSFGDGKGRLTPPILSPDVKAGSVSGLLGADLDGDRRTDLILHLPHSAEIGVLLNNGKRGFAPLATYPTGSSAGLLTVADWNGDSKLDVLTWDPTGNALLGLAGTGRGSFLAPVRIPLGGWPASVAAGEFNGDGILDLAVEYQNSNSEIGILLGSGAGSFKSPILLNAGCCTTSDIKAVDLNGDGRDDLAVAFDRGWSIYDPGGVSVMLNLGGASFAPPVRYDTGAQVVALAAEDFNGDRIPDLAVVNRNSGSVTVLLGGSGGTLTHFGNFAVSRPQAIAISDMNGDGKLDLILLDHTREVVSVLLNRF